MARIAVDAVLLPSQEMTDKVIEANRQLLGPSSGGIVLDKENCLPHISLAMGCIEESDFGEIEGILQEIAEQCALDRLKITGIHLGTNSVGEKVSSFQIERAQALQSLHEEVMQRLKPYLSYNVTADMLLSPPISESTLLWISNFPEKSSFANFFPHTTIGYGKSGVFSVPEEFAVSDIALCHLGNHCTCRKILASLPL